MAFGAGPTGITPALAREAFERAYQTSFSRLLPGVAGPDRQPAHRSDRPPAAFRPLHPGARPGGVGRAGRRGTRPVWFDGRWHDAEVFARLDLPVGAAIAGPAILEQPDATVVVDPGLAARVDRLGNLIVERA